MIAGLMHGMQAAIDPGDDIVDDGRSIVGYAVRHAGELVGARCGQLAAERLLIAGKDIDAETADLLDARPAARALAGKKATSGGSSDTEVKEPTTMPTGAPSSADAVTTHTPVG